MIGRTLAHYRIIAAIGAGGMGEVYRATDTKLGRDVALKVLPAEMASRPERLERFRREAKALAALDHPGVVSVYSVEEAYGVHFLTMQLVEGQPLDRMIPEGGLPVGRILEIGAALAEALGAAHDKGIVHRDLKPANVMVTANARVKVLDFGLARMTGLQPEPSAGSELPTDLRTREGVVMGTVPYMSPEQVSGREVDHRTDLFSLGVILYEMAAGRRPFQGSSSAELASSILRDTPRPLRELRGDLPAGLAQVIERCLEKNAANRFPSTRDVRDGLRGVTAEVSAMLTAAAPSSRPVAAADSAAARADEGFWVAVLPFKYTGGNPDITALAEGLSEEIVTGLSRFSYLRVIARSSTERYSGEAVDVRSVGKGIGARYVMEGSLRQAGPALRIAVQLVDALSGAHLWAETYDRPFRPEEIFALQDELVPRIVSTVADMQGVLPRSMSDAVRSRPPELLSPYEAVLRGFGYPARGTAEELAAARSGLELAVQKAPAYGDAWAMLAFLCIQDHAHGFGLQPDSLKRGLIAAQRAVEAAPSNHLGHCGLAQALFFHRELESFRIAAERAVALNPMDGLAVAFLGELLAYAGDSDRGLALSGRAKQLNPHHPGWYWYVDFYNAYRQHDYDGALRFALKVNMPDHWFAHAALAAAYGQLGKAAAAAKAVRDLLRVRPDFIATARNVSEMWWEPGYVEHLTDGWRKAGLAIPADPGSAASSTAREALSPASGEARTDEGFWVAVLPFKYTGGNTDVTALAGGLSEEIVTGLSRFSYLRVIARSSTLRYRGEAADVRTVGKELGARYVMEGSLRQAGSLLRVAVQLADATTGAELWAESYDRPFRPEDLFALQDDLVPRIVSTVADWYGILPHSMSEAVRSKPVDRLTPYEALLRAFGYYERVTPEEHAVARPILERAVEEAPGRAAAWAMLSMLYGEEHRFGFNALPDPLGRSLQAARRAVAAAPGSHVSHLALAQAHYFRKELDAFRDAAERAVALNRMDGATIEYLGHLLAFGGDWERGCELGERARQLNPHHPAWYWALPFLDAYRKGDYHGARAFVAKAQMPGQYYSLALFAAVYGQLGEHEAADETLRELLALRPDFAEIARDQFGKWYLPQLVEQLIDGLRKAGLAAEASVSTPASSAGKGAELVAIAVLPFSDMSAAKDQEYLCEGMAEEIMNALVRIQGIRVASRTSAFRASRSEKDLAAIGRALSVEQVLEGSVRTAGGQLRVTAQLSDVASGYQLWSERYDREAADIFAVQDEIAKGVVDAVRARLSSGAHALPARQQPADLEAYRSYLMGRYLRHTKNDHGGALRAFEEAVRLDPSHGPSWVGVAEATILAAHYSLIPARAAYARASEVLAIARGLQGESADALYIEGLRRYMEGSWTAVDAPYSRALELQPRHVHALGTYGVILCGWGRCDEGLALLARAREADPLASFPCAMTGVGCVAARRPQESLRHFEDALSFEKENNLALWGSCMAHVALERFEEGIANAGQAVALTRRAAFFVGLLGWALAAAGRKDDARALLEELRARPADAPTVVSKAWLLAALSETDAAFEVVSHAEEERQAFVNYTGLPGFDPLRGDPRWGAFVARVGSPSA